MASTNPEHSSMEVDVDRVDRIYRPGDTVTGSVLMGVKDGWSHQGVEIHVAGLVRLQQNKSVTGFETVRNVRPVVMIEKRIVIQKAGRFAAGSTKVPFEFDLPKEGLHESYHGVNICVSYDIVASCERGSFKRGLSDSKEFIVEVPEGPRNEVEPEPFEITPSTLDNVKGIQVSALPKFSIKGRLGHKHCPINLPFTGELTIQESETPVSSIELQLVRVESITDDATGKSAKDRTEIQNIQIGDGDVCRNLVIPMYMIFPRLFTCPTMKTEKFSVQFEVNLHIIFVDGYMVQESFDIDLYRGR